MRTQPTHPEGCMCFDCISDRNITHSITRMSTYEAELRALLVKCNEYEAIAIGKLKSLDNSVKKAQMLLSTPVK